MILRDTIGLKQKEATHVNVGIQVGTKMTSHMKNLLEHIRAKSLTLTRKDSVISGLRQQLEDARSVSDK